MITTFSDDYFMQQALVEASKAYELDEVPVGAVLVSNQQIIARGHNSVEMLSDVTAHAEMIAMTAAMQHLGSTNAGAISVNHIVNTGRDTCLVHDLAEKIRR